MYFLDAHPVSGVKRALPCEAAGATEGSGPWYPEADHHLGVRTLSHATLRRHCYANLVDAAATLANISHVNGPPSAVLLCSEHCWGSDRDGTACLQIPLGMVIKTKWRDTFSARNAQVRQWVRNTHAVSSCLALRGVDPDPPDTPTFSLVST